MAEGNPLHRNYGSNSNSSKEQPVENERKVESVVSGAAVERKKSLGRRMREAFTGDDAESVGSYLLFQVLIPQIKDLVYDLGESALRRALNGDVARSSGSRGRAYTPYGSQGTVVRKVPGGSTSEPTSSRSDSTDDIIVPTRGDAELVIDKIGNLIETYGNASVSDLKSAVGLTGKFTDGDWGWTHMGGWDIKRVGGTHPGHLLIFPAPTSLK